MANEYVCALSGVEAEDEDLVLGGEDEVGDLPVGWSRITIQRRTVNPRWTEIQQGKAAMVEVTLMQIPEEAREQMRPLITLQVDAQFAALEGGTEEFTTEDEVFFVAPPESDKALAAEYFELRDRFGLSNEAFLAAPQGAEGVAEEEEQGEDEAEEEQE
jgi:hypothetical protein